jgi:hypothetical protein
MHQAYLKRLNKLIAHSAKKLDKTLTAAPQQLDILSNLASDSESYTCQLNPWKKSQSLAAASPA